MQPFSDAPRNPNQALSISTITQSTANRPWLVATVLALAAALLTLPAALGPVRLNDSYWIDWVWLDQFAGQLREGVLYPRWLPLSHNGLGSPVFYYYPPLAFYAGSLFVLGGLSTYAALLATFGVAYLASGLAMYWWLNGHSRAPLTGALIFMAAPYHVYNFYQRGALAEFCATAFLPVVMVGIRRMTMRQSGGFALTSIAFAAMAVTHLPLTLLASLFLFAPYVLLQGREDPAVLLPIGAAFALGLALAAIYLLPAIQLEPFRDSAQLWAVQYLRPSAWSLWSRVAWSMKEYRAILLVIAAALLPLISLLARFRSAWALWSLACFLIAAGALPFLWGLPGLRAVQFPFRLLPVAEFAFATAVATAPRRALPAPVLWLPLVALFAFIALARPAAVSLTMADLRNLHPDVPENLPPGERAYSWPSQWALQVARTHRQPVVANGVTVEPVFSFPAWDVRCRDRLAPTFADPATKLLSHKGQRCSRKLVSTPPEKAGAAISLAAAIGLLLSLLGATRLRPSAKR